MSTEKLEMILRTIFMSVCIMSFAYCQAKVESTKTKTVIIEDCKNIER